MALITLENYFAISSSVLRKALINEFLSEALDKKLSFQIISQIFPQNISQLNCQKLKCPGLSLDN